MSSRGFSSSSTKTRWAKTRRHGNHILSFEGVRDCSLCGQHFLTIRHICSLLQETKGVVLGLMDSGCTMNKHSRWWLSPNQNSRQTLPSVVAMAGCFCNCVPPKALRDHIEPNPLRIMPESIGLRLPLKFKSPTPDAGSSLLIQEQE